jgi:ClpP class serine protease
MGGRDPFGPVTDKWLLAFGNDRGKLRTMQENQDSDLLRLAEQLTEMVAKRVAKRAGASVRRTRALFNHNFIKADRALELGLIDEIR